MQEGSPGSLPVRPLSVAAGLESVDVRTEKGPPTAGTQWDKLGGGPDRAGDIWSIKLGIGRPPNVRAP
jgi:hypothetical protein